ncbi:MAG: OmpA family protein [Alphaproteobacteria bacterium]|nr:OmpA family protein [Alphaproteobacteria bacterium]
MSVYDPYSVDGEDGMISAKPKPANTAWMMTVADLFSLMLTFFVLLYSMSVIQREKFDEISNSLMQRLNVVLQEEEPVILSEKWQIPRATFTYARGLDYLNRVIDQRFEGVDALEGVVVSRGQDRITLSLTSDTMFKPGSVDIEPKAQQMLIQIGRFLSNLGNAITIEGHTDPRPINTAQFPSNWELSMARAVSVANTLRAQGYPYTIDVYGFGSSRHDQLAMLTPERRDQLSRRVDIIVRETVAKY